MKRRKSAIKLSTMIITSLFCLLVIGVFASNMILKGVYEKVDKSDLYWNYNIILDQPYKHLKIVGGNITNIIFEPSKKSTVRVLNYWWGYKKDSTVKAYVHNDTLYLTFMNHYADLGDKNWMGGNVLVRLFGPQLLSVDGSDTNFELQKMKQRSFNFNLKGKSRLEVETYERNMDTLKVAEHDSSTVIFEVSPDLKGSPTMHFKQVTADMTGYSLLGLGHSYTDNIKFNLADTSAVLLSGKTLKGVSK